MKNLCAIVTALSLGMGCAHSIKEVSTTEYKKSVTPPCAQESIEILDFNQNPPAIMCKEESSGKEMICSYITDGSHVGYKCSHLK
ncbi:MAG: hypothetical protein AABY26_01125 [Nanoarchaeota archaeon]